MMIILSFLVGVFAGYRLCRYDHKYTPESAVYAKIKVGAISKKEK